MRPLSKNINKKSSKFRKRDSSFNRKRFSSSSSSNSTFQDLENISQVLNDHKVQLAKRSGSWKVEPKDSIEVYKERRRRQKRPNGRIDKKGKSDNKKKTKRKPVKRKKRSSSRGQRR